jgi:hypothetical protein
MLILLYSLGGVRLSLGTMVSNGPIAHGPDDRQINMAHWWGDT